MKNKNILVDDFINCCDLNANGVDTDRTIWVDGENVFNEDLSLEIENILRSRHIFEWWVDEFGDIKILTVEQHSYLEKLGGL